MSGPDELLDYGCRRRVHVEAERNLIVQPPPDPAITPRPRRFYAKITLDPNRPTPMVSNIAQSILSELDRARGTTITLTLDIAAETVDGFSKDVETIVCENAASLRFTDFGFEEE
jgi:hypothetical protein